jgi:hypothetical protein
MRPAMLTFSIAGRIVVTMKKVIISASMAALLWGFYHSGAPLDMSHQSVTHIYPARAEIGFN